MKTLYIFNQMMMNGMVTIRTVPALFASKELADKTRDAVIKANKEDDGRMAIRTYCSEVEEVQVYENENEVHILQYEPLGTSNTPPNSI